MEVQRLPLGSQQLDGLQLTVSRGISEYFEQLEEVAASRLHLSNPMSSLDATFTGVLLFFGFSRSKGLPLIALG